MYSGNMMWSNIATFLVIAIVIICTLMPIWPAAAKHVLWYCSVTFLIVIFSLLILRAVAFLLMWLLGYEFWVFPRLFDESLSFQDSFVPVYTFEKGTPGQGYYRICGLLALGGFVYWACTQPTEFDSLLKAQSEFIDDLYSGKLLADVAHNPPAHLDRSKRVPSLEDLLKQMEADEKEKIGGTEGEGHDEGAEYVDEEAQRSAGGAEWVKLEQEAAAGDLGHGGPAPPQGQGHGSTAEVEEVEWTAPDFDEQQHDEM
jgi:translocation protein SEC62